MDISYVHKNNYLTSRSKGTLHQLILHLPAAHFIINFISIQHSAFP